MRLKASGKFPNRSLLSGVTSWASIPRSVAYPAAPEGFPCALRVFIEGEGLRQPERAEKERPLLAGEPVRSTVAAARAPRVGEPLRSFGPRR